MKLFDSPKILSRFSRFYPYVVSVLYPYSKADLGLFEDVTLWNKSCFIYRKSQPAGNKQASIWIILSSCFSRINICLLGTWPVGGRIQVFGYLLGIFKNLFCFFNVIWPYVQLGNIIVLMDCDYYERLSINKIAILWISGDFHISKIFEIEMSCIQMAKAFLGQYLCEPLLCIVRGIGEGLDHTRRWPDN